MVVGMSLYSQIREASTSGGSQRFIAKRLGISRQTRSTAREQQCPEPPKSICVLRHPPLPALCCYQGGSRTSLLPPHINFALFAPKMDFTQNLGLTPL